MSSDLSQALFQALDLINAKQMKKFSLPPNTFIGNGSLARIGEATVELGIRRAFIVIDEVVDSLGLAEPMYRALAAHQIPYEKYTQPGQEPQSAAVETAAQQFVKSGCDGMIAIGGGSALDAAKGIILLAANPGLTVKDMLEHSNIKNSRAPLIAVPTTAGTGSEATAVSVITDTATHHKLVIAHPDFIPDLAIVDACLTLRVPPKFTAATGIDALTHSIESYVAIGSTPLTRALAYQAIRMVGESLAIATGQGADIPARESMALASYMAGIAFSNAGLGLCHSMAHQIGPKYGVPHGIANAILLPSVMAFNELVCKKQFCDIGLALTGEIMKSSEVIASVAQLAVDVGMPVNLAEVGGKPEDFGEFADGALKDYCLSSNPRTASKEQIISVYQHALTRKLH